VAASKVVASKVVAKVASTATRVDSTAASRIVKRVFVENLSEKVLRLLGRGTFFMLWRCYLNSVVFVLS
jgi:hypothetical protein